MAAHPIIGSWRVTVRVPGAGQEGANLATYTADGTVVVAFPSPSPAPPGQDHRLEYFSPALGSWVATGERSVAQTFVSLGADENGNPIGTHTITAEADVAADGRSWSGSFRIDIASATGAMLGSVAGTVTATRIEAGRLAK